MPKDRLLNETSVLLKRAGWGLSGYSKGIRSYRLKSERFPGLSAKVFHEKDIPVQVSVGNYDLGICGLDWVEELLVKYPSAALIKLKNLGYGEGSLYMVASQSAGITTVAEIQAKRDIICLVSEYPNLTESFALRNRLKRFSIFPLWGAAEAYLPENADLALVSGKIDEKIFNHDLVSISNELDFNACLIANKTSWESRDFSELLDSIEEALIPWLAERKLKGTSGISSACEVGTASGGGQHRPAGIDEGVVRLALPDGHHQKPTLRLLNKAGIGIDDYPSEMGNRRPTISLDGVAVKVIRPQDMPSQVANGSFDLAITGWDWLREHLYQFPSSPVNKLLDLNFGRVKIVAVVSKELPVEDIDGLRQLYKERGARIRIASEYVHIADKYGRDNHLGMYRVIPTWGASEAFLPEDADLLIENTETGRTIARHNLKIIDTLCKSTACLIGNKDIVPGSTKDERIKSITETLRPVVDA